MQKRGENNRAMRWPMLHELLLFLVSKCCHSHQARHTVLTHLRRMVLKINFRRLVKNKSPEEEIKAYNWHFNSHKELPRPQKRRAYGLFRKLHRAKRIKNHAS